MIQYFCSTHIYTWYSMIALYCINPLTLTAAKSSLTIAMKFCRKSKFKKIFDGEISMRRLPTTLLQIFCKTILNFKVIVKNIIDPDDNVWSNL